MRRWLYAQHRVLGQPTLIEQRLREHVRDLLRQATGTTDTEDAGDGSFALHLGHDAGDTAFGRWVRASTGVASRSGERLRIPVQWHAEPGRHTFPAFDGVLELEPMSGGLAQLALVGSYKMPLGPVGAALDIAGLHRLVERTGERLVEAVAGQLEDEVASRGTTPEVSAAGAGRLHVADVMSPEPLVLGESLPLRSAALLLLHYDVGGAPVVADSGDLIGVLTDADLVAKEASFPGIIGRRARRAERSRQALTAGEACSRPARTTTPHATLHDAVAELLAHDVSRLVVVDDCRIAGMLTRRDVLKALTRQDAELRALAAAELAASGLAGVEARFDGGVVRLSGSVRYRSDAERLHSRIADIDGIIAIEDELEWEEDDLALPPPMLM